MKATVKVKMIDHDGFFHYWDVWQEPKCFNITFKTFLSGWAFQSEDGSQRFVAGSWKKLVKKLHETADNYGYTTKLS